MAVTQSHYRFGIDELAESTHGWYAAQDANPTFGVIPVNTTFLLRFCCQCDGTALSNADFEFQYRKNGGTWTQITTATTNVKAVTPTCWANAANTTQRLSGTGTFESSSQGCTTDGISGGAQFDIVANGNGETECALQLVGADLAAGDFLEFRLTRDGAVLMDTYSVTPALGIPLTPAVAPSESSKFAEALLSVALTVLMASAPTESVKIADTVTAAIESNDLSHAVSAEALKADDGGRVELIGLGNPIKVVDGPVIAVLVGDDLLINVAAESLKVVDSVLGLTLDPEQVSLTESLKVVDSVLAEFGLFTSLSESFKVVDLAIERTLNPEEVPLGENLRIVDTTPDRVLNPEEISLSESLKIVDTLTAQFGLSAVVSESLSVVDQTPNCTLNPEQAAPTEQVKVDDRGFVELIGLGNAIKVVDGPVVAQLVSAAGDLSASISEVLKVVDTLSVVGDVLLVNLTEDVKIFDGGGVELNKDETIKIGDIVTVTLNPEQATPSESLKVVDTLITAITPEQASLTELLKVADTVAVLLDPEQTSLFESLNVVDTVSLTLNPEETTIADGLKVVDAPSVTLNPEQATPSESLKVVDTVQAARVDAGSLAATLADENVKVADTVSLTLDPERATSSEALKVVDAVTASMDLFVILTETLKIGEDGEVELSRDETIKIGEALAVTITPIFAFISEALRVVDTAIQASTGELSISISESLKVVDAALASVGSLFVGVTENVKVADTGQVELVYFETIKISDSITAVMGAAGNDLSASLTESLKVVDSIQVALQLAQTASESLKVADQVTASLQLATTITDESLKIADSLSAVLQLGVQVANEGLKVTDSTPTGRLDPLQILIIESLRALDADPSVTTGTTLAVIASETLKITDAPLASIDPEIIATSDALKVTDTVLATLNPEQIEIAESVRCIDTVQASLDVLNVSVSEVLKVTDSLSVSGPTVIEVVGNYVTVINVVGNYATAIDIVGERV